MPKSRGQGAAGAAAAPSPDKEPAPEAVQEALQEAVPAPEQELALDLPADPGDGAGWGASLAAALAAGGALLLCLMVALAALPALFGTGGESPFHWTWQPYAGQFGILPMCAGTLALTAFALALGWPLALGLVCWLLCEEAKCLAPLVRFTSVLVRFMTTIPTVVYGFAAVFLLTPCMRSLFGGTGLGLATAGLVLTLLILPSMLLTLEAGLKPRLEALCPWGQALGFSKLQLLRRFVLPQAGRTLAAAAVLGFGRAAGDTLLPLMLAGNAPLAPEGIFASLRTLSAHMAMATANEVGGGAYNSLFAAGCLLLGATALASLVLRRLMSSARAAAGASGTGPEEGRP